MTGQLVDGKVGGDDDELVLYRIGVHDIERDVPAGTVEASSSMAISMSFAPTDVPAQALGDTPGSVLGSAAELGASPEGMGSPEAGAMDAAGAIDAGVAGAQDATGGDITVPADGTLGGDARTGEECEWGCGDRES